MKIVEHSRLPGTSRQRSFTARIATLGGAVVACVASLAPAALWAASAGALSIPFQQSFRGDRLDAAWKVDVSGGNAVGLADGALQITAATHTYAHIQRPLEVDLVRAACTLKPGGGISWVSSLFLYWDPRNWCQVSVLESEPSYYAVELIDGEHHEFRRPLPAKADWYRVAIALGADCIRFQSTTDGQSWESWLVLERPESWSNRPPALLVVGKGFSRFKGEPRFTGAHLDNDYADRGPQTISRVRDISVEPTPAAEARLTDLEKKTLAEAGRDLLGEAELGVESDPSFASVSRHFPPLLFPRESLGVKDGPQEFVVLPDGSLGFGGATASFRVGTSPRPIAQGRGDGRGLLEGYLPIVVVSNRQDNLRFEQTAFGWSPELSPDAPLSAFVALKIANAGTGTSSVPAQFVVAKPVASWQLNLGPGETQTLYVRVPFARPGEAGQIDRQEFERRLDETAAVWRALLSKGIRIRVPEQAVNDAWRAWLAYNFINVDKRGNVYEPHDGGAGFYEEVFGYSASRYCYALDLMGYHEEAQRYLDSILTFVTPQGLLVVNYGLPDTGAQLWAMSMHYQITRDAAWLQRVAPTMIRMCDWIIAERKTSMAKQPSEAPWFGLIKYKPYCDEPTPAYSYHTDTYLVLGMRETAAALQAVGMTEPAERLATESAAYEKDILKSMDRAVIERKGTRMLPVFPETRALLERVGYTGADYYSLVGSMVLETSVIPPADPRARLITDLLEQKNGLVLGTSQFDRGIDHAYTYGYWLNCLQRDEVKRAILGFYTSLAYGMSRGTYAGVEVTGLRTGANAATLPHLYSGTHQLLLLRNMLLREDAQDLWIGQAIPRPWLQEGKEVRVENAPTYFGKAGFVIRSTDRARQMTIELNPPADRPPQRIHLRLRHPNHRALTEVTVNGSPHREFRGETVTLTGLKGPATIQAKFD